MVLEAFQQRLWYDAAKYRDLGISRWTHQYTRSMFQLQVDFENLANKENRNFTNFFKSTRNPDCGLKICANKAFKNGCDAFPSPIMSASQFPLMTAYAPEATILHANGLKPFTFPISWISLPINVISVSFVLDSASQKPRLSYQTNNPDRWDKLFWGHPFAQ